MENGSEGGPVRRPGHGTHVDDEAMGKIATADGNLHVSDLTIPTLHGVINEPASFEEAFISFEVQPWWEQVTLRGIVVSIALGFLFVIITHKLNLTVGVIPSLNVSAGLLGFLFIRTWTAVTTKLKLFTKPFTRQENTVIQTCVVSCYGLAFSGMTCWLS